MSILSLPGVKSKGMVCSLTLIGKNGKYFQVFMGNEFYSYSQWESSSARKDY